MREEKVFADGNLSESIRAREGERERTREVRALLRSCARVLEKSGSARSLCIIHYALLLGTADSFAAAAEDYCFERREDEMRCDHSGGSMLRREGRVLERISARLSITKSAYIAVISATARTWRE